MGDIGSKNTPQQLNIPPFLSAGGVTPQQQALAQYSLGQDLMGQASMFGSEGLGQSTMATQGAEGARNFEAQQLGQASDANQGAQYQRYGQDVSALENQLQNQSVLNQQQNASLGSLASGLGNLFGSSKG